MKKTLFAALFLLGAFPTLAQPRGLPISSTVLRADDCTAIVVPSGVDELICIDNDDAKTYRCTATGTCVEAVPSSAAGLTGSGTITADTNGDGTDDIVLDVNKIHRSVTGGDLYLSGGSDENDGAAIWLRSDSNNGYLMMNGVYSLYWSDDALYIDANSDSTLDWKVSGSTGQIFSYEGTGSPVIRSDQALYFEADNDQSGSGDDIFFDANGDSAFEIRIDATSQRISFDADSDGVHESYINASGTLIGAATGLDGDGDATPTFAPTADESAVEWDDEEDGTWDLRFTQKRLEGRDVTGDIEGDGTLDTNPPRLSRIVEGAAHRDFWGGENALRGYVFDQWLDIFRQRRKAATYSASEDVTAAPTRCASASCNSWVQYLCVDDTDTDADGTAEIGVNDVVLVGSETGANKGTTHAVTDTDGDGTATHAPCAAGEYRLTIAPWLDEDDSAAGLDRNNDGSMDAGLSVVNLWDNDFHPNDGIYYLIGYRVGYLSRHLDGSHGPDLLTNGAMEYTGSARGWETDGVLVARDWPVNMSANALQCTEGDGSDDCVYRSGSTGSYLRQSSWVEVQPGAVYVFAGTLLSGTAGDDAAVLYTDVDGDGVLETDETGCALTFDSTLLNHYRDMPGRWFVSCEIPQDVTRVKPGFVLGSTANRPLVDDVSFRQSSGRTTDASDDATNPTHGTTEFAISDPGEREIVIMGDSWAAETAIEQGLEDALEERFGRSLDGQITKVGIGGSEASYFLDDETWNYWPTEIGDRDPLYCVVSLGVNEINRDTGLDTYISNLRKLNDRIAAVGCVPIWLGTPPVGATAGVASDYEEAHQYRDRQRDAVLDRYTQPTRIAQPEWRPWDAVREFEDCLNTDAANYSSAQGVVRIYPIMYDDDPGDSQGGVGVCRLELTSSAVEGDDAMVAVAHSYYGWGGSTSHFTRFGTLQAGKLREFNARVTASGSELRSLVGGVITSSDEDLSTKTDGAFFWCAPGDDVDGDGTAGDAEDDNWWAVTMSSATDCLQLVDGDGDGSVDCDLDGTADTAAADWDGDGTVETTEGRASLYAVDTGVGCVDGNDFDSLRITHTNDGAFLFYVRDSATPHEDWSASDLKATISVNTPLDRGLAVWSAWSEMGATTGTASYLYLDYLAYEGER